MIHIYDMKAAAAQQVEYMAAVKEAFLARDALAVVMALVAEPLQRSAAGRPTTADANTVQLVLTFLRNLIVLPDRAPTAGAPSASRLHVRMTLFQTRVRYLQLACLSLFYLLVLPKSVPTAGVPSIPQCLPHMCMGLSPRHSHVGGTT